MPGVEVRVVETDDQGVERVVPPGQPGELRVKVSHMTLSIGT